MSEIVRYATEEYVKANTPHTISSKVFATIPAANVVLDSEIILENININPNNRYYIDFLDKRRLCSISVSEEVEHAIICNFDNYFIQAYNSSNNVSLAVYNYNTEPVSQPSEDTIVFTDIIIHELENKYLDSSYLETDLILQNSISLGRIGDIGYNSSAIGYRVTASGIISHAEGYGTTASGEVSHAEGGGTTASGEVSHAEGNGTTASGKVSHAEGNGTTASGAFSHAEGYGTTASGEVSHAEGYGTTASGAFSHAEGYGTTASSEIQHVQGRYNIEDTENKYAHIVGNGTSDSERSNAHTLTWTGDGWYAGKLSQEGTPTEEKDLTTKKYVDENGLTPTAKTLLATLLQNIPYSTDQSANVTAFLQELGVNTTQS